MKNKTIVMKFGSEWQRGTVTGTTKRDGCNVVVRWEGEKELRLQFLRLEKYSTARRAEESSWCIVSKVRFSCCCFKKVLFEVSVCYLDRFRSTGPSAVGAGASHSWICGVTNFDLARQKLPCSIFTAPVGANKS